MRLPQPLLQSPYFLFQTQDELLRALADGIDDAEIDELRRLDGLGLMPVTSPYVLGTMFGINPGLIWSLVNRPNKHYRTFSIPKGTSVRWISAPRVVLKIIQKWISTQIARQYVPLPHVYGFVHGRSHIMAAQQHLGADWVFSVDIENFFPSTPTALIANRLSELGYSDRGLSLLTSLVCKDGGLPQGSPASPTLSNLCFAYHDQLILDIAKQFDVRLTRYADDIVFSGTGDFPDELARLVVAIFERPTSPWTLNGRKTEILKSGERRKVHGLLVHGDSLRLTKGYRNRLRAYRHLLAAGKISPQDRHEVHGHLAYALSVDKLPSGK